MTGKWRDLQVADITHASHQAHRPRHISSGVHRALRGPRGPQEEQGSLDSVCPSLFCNVREVEVSLTETRERFELFKPS